VLLAFFLMSPRILDLLSRCWSLRRLRHQWKSFKPQFIHAYADSQKEPDLLIRADNLRLPKVVIESGWSESWPRLRDDMNLWIVGGNGEVKVVILIKWGFRPCQGICRTVGVYRPDTNGMPVRRQIEVLFKTLISLLL
jgi:hypothetical protein